ncbi:MAG: hypothetical protein AAF870_07885 [Pseudomonadota bacterium]
MAKAISQVGWTVRQCNQSVIVIDEVNLRTVESDRPVGVNYRLSEIGNSAIAAAQMFVDWATSQNMAIRESRKIYDAKFGQ